MRYKILFLFLLFILFLGSFSLDKDFGRSEASLEDKVAQMIIVYDKADERELYKEMGVGGFFLSARGSEEGYLDAIEDIGEGYFIATDLEGCRNPFSDFREFESFSEIDGRDEAYQLGYEQGILLKELGFNLDLSPVLDLEDDIDGCRSFSGNVIEKASAYVSGLKENGILVAAKHYPGRTLVGSDTHENLAYALITSEDIEPFSKLFSEVDAVMVSHVIVFGEVNSGGKPACASESLVSDLKEQFDGLIITDELTMGGISDYYKDKDEMYIEVFGAGNDIVISFDDAQEIKRMIDVVVQAVEDGRISESKIDESYEKILVKKKLI